MTTLDYGKEKLPLWQLSYEGGFRIDIKVTTSKTGFTITHKTDTFFFQMRQEHHLLKLKIFQQQLLHPIL